MGKRNQAFRSKKDPENLRRFRTIVQKFVDDTTPADDAKQQQPHSKQQTGRGKRKPKRANTLQNRKQRRKEERKLKKVKNLAFSQRKHVPTMDEYKEAKLTVIKEKRQAKREQQQNLVKQEQDTEEKVKVDKKEDVRRKGLLEANQQDVRILKQLEKQLKMKKKQKLPQSFMDDGLDYILDALDSEKLYTTYGHSSDEEGEATLRPDMRKKPKTKLQNEDTEEFLSDGDNSDDGDEEMLSEDDDGTNDDSSDDMDDLSDDSDVNEDFAEAAKRIDIIEDSDVTKTSESILKTSTKKQSDSETGKGKRKAVSFDEIQTKSDESDENSDGTENEDDLVDKLKYPVLKEDIYGRLRDEEGNIVASSKATGAYLPPAKRPKTADGEDAKRKIQLDRLRKQLKGLINRVSESNIQPISSQIEELYRTNSRADVSETFCSIVTAACISPTLTPDRLSMELSMLMAILHGNVGPEVGAVFIQNLARQFDGLQKVGSQYGQGKEIDNVITLFSHLYNFKIIHSRLVFDILDHLTEKFGEKDIELILLLLKNIGFTLRKDDPSALKEAIVQIQSKANTVDTSGFTDKTRVKFMLETILAVRNNNMRKIPNYDPSHIDHLRKQIRNYVRGGKLVENQLRISLPDLLNTEETGRWWLVGSAWSGPQMDTRTDRSQDADAARIQTDSGSSTILDVARKQRMNTETRRNIFCTIMSSEDFADSFEKLLKLGLKHKQEREIVYVLVDCCLQEKNFNQFYAYLLQKFCEYDRRFQMTFQFHLWDKFSMLAQMSTHNRDNLAQLLAHLLATKAMSLSVLKTVEFGTLEKTMVRFLKQVLEAILLDYPEHVTMDIFSRIAPLSKLHLLHEGLKLFMQHFLLRSKAKLDTDIDSKLAERIKLAEQALLSCSGDVKL